MRNLMPELPEVESFGKYLDKTSLNKKIESVDVKSPELLQNIDISALKGNLEGNKFQFTKRHGKYLFVYLDNKNCLILHFGMTGNLKYYKKSEEEPSYGRFLVNFEDKSHLAFVDPRKFGKINLISKMEDFIKEKKLGPDAARMDFKSFIDIFKKRKGAIKPALMNQHIFAGIGNIYSDEILFQTCVHPKTPVNKLSDDKLKEIFMVTKEVLETAIDRNLKHEELPDSYIIPNRVKNGKCPNSDVKLETLKVGGRTAYFCPECQKEIL